MSSTVSTLQIYIIMRRHCARGVLILASLNRLSAWPLGGHGRWGVNTSISHERNCGCCQQGVESGTIDYYIFRGIALLKQTLSNTTAKLIVQFTSPPFLISIPNLGRSFKAHAPPHPSSLPLRTTTRLLI